MLITQAATATRCPRCGSTWLHVDEREITCQMCSTTWPNPDAPQPEPIAMRSVAVPDRSKAPAPVVRQPWMNPVVQNSQACGRSRVTQITALGCAVLDALPPAEVAELRRLNQRAAMEGPVCR